MSNEWKTEELGSLAIIHDSKRVPLSGAQRSQRQGEYRYYGAQGVIDYIDDYLFDGSYLLIAEDGENLRSRKQPIANFAHGKFWVNNHAHIITIKEALADIYFISAWLNYANISGYITGAAQPKLSQGNLKLIQIPLPSLPEQKRIAGILSAYDDLIENNLRRIKILEEMAQSLYREWFVHFRFPGHESTPMIDSPLGPIPEGWEVKKLKKVASVNSQSIRKNSAPERINYIDIKSVSTGSIDEVRPMTFEEAPSRARRIVKHGDIIWSTVRPNRRSFSLIMEPEENLIASTGFAVLTAQDLPWSYLYQATTTQDFTSYLVNHASGAAYPAVNASIFENAKLVMPSCDLLAKFNDVVEPLQLKQHNLFNRNNNLRKTRDLILPKLLSPSNV